MAALTDVTIGFRASPPLAVKVAQPDLDAFVAALGGEGWHELPIQDGSVRISVADVLFLRTERDEQRVGFGLG